MRAPGTLRLTAAARAALAHAWATARRIEPCGYLLGRGDVGVRVVAGRNVHPRPADAFRLAPAEQLAARHAARRAGLDVIGIWHAHRLGPPQPSLADRAGHGRFAPPWMVIVGRDAAGRAAVGAWRAG